MNYEQARTNMLMQQIRTWGVSNQTVLDVIANTPREYFVPPIYKDVAFADMCIPLAHGQTMLLPREEAKIIQTLNIQISDRVLEVGTGTGYMTALLAPLCKYVDSVDIFSDFTEQAQSKLTELNIHNINLLTGDVFDLEFTASYDVIVITGALFFLPMYFRKLLNSGGRLFCVAGQPPAMEASLITHHKNGHWTEEKLFETVTSRLINAPKQSLFSF